MKIVSWNCAGAMRKKFSALSAISADIFVLQECENPEFSKDDAFKAWATNYLWVGENKHKGLAVVAKGDIKLTQLDWDAGKLQLFLPCLLNDELTLVAIWTKQANSPNFQYIGQLWKYLQLHGDKLNRPKTLLLGDFNSNTRWDEWDRWWNHSDVVRQKPYHIDYAFLSKDVLDRASLKIGAADDWLRHSDHMPLQITID
ncbi:MAG TPA: endonuclease/exonuclease/phosphatase family protein [Methylotenera sp.]|nr:endonuclease/exonuclease/phosphatase family protein [Methylotenera sp.]